MSDPTGPHNQAEPASGVDAGSSADGKAEATPTGNTNPFDQFIGIIPPLPGGSVAFVRELRGHVEDETLTP